MEQMVQSSDGATLCQIFLFLLQEEKEEKQATFLKFGNSTEGKIFGRLRTPISGEKKRKIRKYKTLREKTNLEI